MPRYGDDQCEECGAVRVSGSKLCVGCMVRMITRLENRIANKIEEVETLKGAIEKFNGRLEDVIRYGFQQNQEIARLNRYIRELELKVARGWNDEKDRQGEDKEG